MRTRLCFALAAIVMLTAQSSSAQLRFTGLRLGYVNPKDTKAGLMLGMDLTAQVDEAVELGISVNGFRRHHQQKTLIAKLSSSGGLVESEVQEEVDVTTFFVPIMGEAIVHFGDEDFHLFANGGLGYEMLWNNEKNFIEEKSERRYYSGFTWLAGGGFQYRLGSRSAFIGEVFYHNATVKRSEKKNTRGLPTWKEVDLSGVGFRGGLRFGLW